MKRLPSLLRSTPPSPRTPSVTRMPLTLGGQTIPVGWNCTNSMSSSEAPALYASAWPSAVYSQLLLVTLKARPTPPVANTTAFKVTSNSWEYTADGQALAYNAGASLLDMEFIQFHPTGMVWPPSVKGILVTEGVRGEGGVLRNKDGKRFMFDDIPENYRSSTADNEEEGWRYTQADKNARRPPALLTRDHLARFINREEKAGRGSPHGRDLLGLWWDKDRIHNAVVLTQE